MREGCFPKGRCAEQTKTLYVGDTAVCPPLVHSFHSFHFLTFLSLGPLCWGSCQSSNELRVVTLQAQTHGEVPSRAASRSPLLRQHDFLALWAGPKPLPYSGSAILRRGLAGFQALVCLFLTSSVTPDRAFNLSETLFPYLQVTELPCTSAKISTKCFVRCKVPFG